MITLRRASERGHAEHGWLKSYHTFSFASYQDPEHVGFRDLRVINEDFVQPGKGFDTHSHRDMEIVTYVLDGVLEHKDSMGNGSMIRPGEVQRMTAGTGVTHSEYNHSQEDIVHFLQVWILPEREGLEPSYEQTVFPESERLNSLRLIASRDGKEDSVIVHQDVEIYSSILETGKSISHRLRPDRYAWVQVARGSVAVLGESLEQGDAAAISSEDAVELQAAAASEIVLFVLK
jgi:redox-sensitive bicupin YhaK (pirin superfamily)